MYAYDQSESNLFVKKKDIGYRFIFFFWKNGPELHTSYFKSVHLRFRLLLLIMTSSSPLNGSAI